MPTNIEQTYVLEMPITSPDISLYRTETNRRSEILRQAGEVAPKALTLRRSTPLIIDCYVSRVGRWRGADDE
jgi:hypothetical protein